VSIRVTKLQRHPDGYWTARVSAGGTTLPVHRKYGSWMIELAKQGVRCEVKPGVAALLQQHVRRAERRERTAFSEIADTTQVQVPLS
jgi:hypothetical protein